MTDFNPAIDSFFDASHATTDDVPSGSHAHPSQIPLNAIAIDASSVIDNAFAELGLAKVLLKSLEKSGYTTPTPIQAQAIPVALEGRDLLLSAQTGSGKTAAFVLPILHLLTQNSTDTKTDKKSRHTPKVVKALVLTPTRELAHQVSDSVRRYGDSMRDLFSVPLVGGSAYTGQIRALKKGVQVIIATPGRLLDHMNAGRIDLSELSMLVLDEADRMLDMGFADDIQAILAATPNDRQTIMSSATWDGAVGDIAASFTKNPARINIKVESAHIDEKVYFCDSFDHKNKLLEQLICDQDRQQAIVFAATKRSTEELAKRLADWGHKVCFLHGDLPQGKRNRIVADLRDGKFDIVVATDVAARGLDLPNISHVFNYDLPRQVEDYVHRIGRSGRAGRTGIAVNLCSRDDRRQLIAINRYLKRDMTESTVEGLEPRFNPETDRRGKFDNHDKRGRGKSGYAGEKNSRFGKGYGKSTDSKGGNGYSNHRTETDNNTRKRRDGSSFGNDQAANRGDYSSSRYERAAKTTDKPRVNQGNIRDKRTAHVGEGSRVEGSTRQRTQSGYGAFDSTDSNQGRYHDNRRQDEQGGYRGRKSSNHAQSDQASTTRGGFAKPKNTGSTQSGYQGAQQRTTKAGADKPFKNTASKPFSKKPKTAAPKHAVIEEFYGRRKS